MRWLSIDTIPDDDRPKLIAMANGRVIIAPGVVEMTVAGTPPDQQWRPTWWMYVPKAPMQ